MSYLVKECESFSSLSYISKKNIKIVADISDIFIRYSSLSSLPNILIFEYEYY